jgi:hypothetical protein
MDLEIRGSIGSPPYDFVVASRNGLLFLLYLAVIGAQWFDGSMTPPLPSTQRGDMPAAREKQQ